MTLVVPFDGSQLAKAALVRAQQFDEILNEGVIAVTVIPQLNTQYARKHGWIEQNEPFDIEQIVGSLRAAAEEVAPDATFEHILVDADAQHGTIAKKLRRFAHDAETTILFIGSENAGRLVKSMSVGSNIASDRNYDTMIISSRKFPKIPALEKVAPAPDLD
jgi:nucleotide-binding universal stress UspA family protein